MTLEEAVFEFDLELLLSLNRQRHADLYISKDYECFMLHIESWQITLTRCCLQWLANFPCYHRYKAHTATGLLSGHESSSMVCPWKTLSVWDTLSLTFFSILNLRVEPTHHSSFKCTCFWNTFPFYVISTSSHTDIFL